MKLRYIVCNSFAQTRVVGAKVGDGQLYDVRVSGTVDDSAVVTMAGQEVARIVAARVWRLMGYLGAWLQGVTRCSCGIRIKAKIVDTCNHNKIVKEIKFSILWNGYDK